MAVKIDYERFITENIRPIIEPCKKRSNKKQNRALFIEEAMVEAVKGIMLVGVNDLLGTIEEPVPMINFNEQNTDDVLTPVISVSISEQTNQELLAHLKAYKVYITIPIRDNNDGFFYSWTCYCALCRIFTDNHTLGGVVDKAEITERRMKPPVKKYNREKWEVCLTLRATVNRRVYASNWY